MDVGRITPGPGMAVLPAWTTEGREEFEIRTNGMASGFVKTPFVTLQPFLDTWIWFDGVMSTWTSAR